MGLPIETTLDFNDELSTRPSSPSKGLRLYAYSDPDHGGMLRLTGALDEDTDLISGTSRASALYFTDEVGTPLLPSDDSSPLEFEWAEGRVRVGDYLARKLDGEVFQWQQVVVPGRGIVDVIQDLGFALGAGSSNPVTNTIAKVSLTTSQTVASGNVKIAFDTVTFDAGSCWDATNKRYVAPRAGYYRVNANALFSDSAAQDLGLRLFINGASVEIGDFATQPGASAGTDTRGFDDIIKLSAADYVEIFAATAGGTVVGGTSFTYMSVNLIAPLSSAPVAPNTAARAYRAAAFGALTTQQVTAIPLDTIRANEDPGGHIQGGAYKVTSAGFYSAQGAMAVNGAGNATLPCVGGIYHNSTATQEVSQDHTNTNNFGGEVITFAATFYCAVGDTIGIFVDPLISGLSLGVGASNTFLSVVKVDQPVGSGQIEANTSTRAYASAAFNFATSGFTAVPIDNPLDDPGGHLVSGTHSYKVTSPGVYSVKGNVNAPSTGASQWLECVIAKNGAETLRGSATVSTAAGQPLSSVAAGDVRCAANDSITLQALASNALAANTLPSTNSLSVVKVSN